jgi:hypothetical protein
MFLFVDHPRSISYDAYLRTLKPCMKLHMLFTKCGDMDHAATMDFDAKQLLCFGIELSG